MNSNDPNQLDLLFNGYVDDALSDAEETSLCEVLRQDAEAVEHFVRNCYLHWQLYDLARQRSHRSEALQRPHLAPVDLARPASADLDQSRQFGKGSTSTKFFALAGCAVLAFAMAWMYLLPGPVVAQISEISANADWSGSHPGPSLGDLLREGRQLVLRRGRAVVTLVSGAKVTIAAPAKLSVLDRNSIGLDEGTIRAVIPRQASGFQIKTSIGRFVDLGTEFTLQLVGASSCRLMVFRGLVELQPAVGARGGVLRVPQGRAVSYDADSGKVVVLPYDEKLRNEL
jgi:hypothetical protein